MSKNQYSPIQPSVKNSDKIFYQEIAPSSENAPFVYCYWQLHTNHPLGKDFQYKVVADGCIDIFFDLNNPSDSSVMGFCKKFTAFSLGKEFAYCGIRFNPSFFSQIFLVDAKSLSDLVTPLKEVSIEMSTFIRDHFSTSSSLPEIKELFDLFLGQWIRINEFSEDTRFYNALKVIYEKKGCLETEVDLKTGLSPRQLRRIFNFYIGTTPKSFSKVVRFQSVLKQLQESNAPIGPSAYLDAGFFDQAHFIKEFKNYYGVTPTDAFR